MKTVKYTVKPFYYGSGYVKTCYFGHKTFDNIEDAEYYMDYLKIIKDKDSMLYREEEILSTIGLVMNKNELIKRGKEEVSINGNDIMVGNSKYQKVQKD